VRRGGWSATTAAPTTPVGSTDYLTNWSTNYEPTDHAVTRTGKRAAGRTLDYRTHDEYPEAT